MKTCEVLREAADLIETHGHVKRAYTDNVNGGYCAVGAIKVVVMGDVHTALIPDNDDQLITFHNTFNVVDEYLRDKVCTSASRIAVWNDEDERTPEEVIDLLRTIANLHEMRQQALKPKLTRETVNA